MVTRAKGRPPRDMIDAGWPYQVELDVPGRGFGRHLGTITGWLQEHAPPPMHCRGGSRRSLEAVRWAFQRLEPAEAFQATFGGRLIDAGDENSKSLKMRPPDARPMRDILAERETIAALDADVADERRYHHMAATMDEDDDRVIDVGDPA